MWVRASLLVLSLFGFGSPTWACGAWNPAELTDVEYADIVVVGRISNYTSILGPTSKQKLQNLSYFSALSPEVVKSASASADNYATFDVLIDEVLVGKAREKISVTWDSLTHSEPESMPSGPFLIALRVVKAAAAPLNSTASHDLLAVLQAPCSQAFIFESASDEAREVRRILNR